MAFPSEVEASERPNGVPWARIVANSAVILAALSGLFYWLGHQVQNADAATLGIPKHLLPEPTPQSTLTLGFLNGSLYVGYFLLVYLVLYLLLFAAPRARGFLFGGMWIAMRRHPHFYGVFVAFAVIVLINKAPYWIPKGSSWLYADQNLPVVKTMVSKAAADKGMTAADGDGLLFLCRNSGWVILKRPGEKRFRLVREDSLASLELEAAEVRTNASAKSNGTPAVK